jgi:hypothetical protein
VDAWLEQEYQLTPDAREALRSRFLEGKCRFSCHDLPQK